VLVASANSVIAGMLIFFGNQQLQKIHAGVRAKAADVMIVLVVGIVVLVLTVIMSKIATGRTNKALFSGGIVSGHSAIGFFLAVTIIYSSGNNLFTAVLALLMAVIIAQSRVEAGIHTIQEVIMGAVVAIFLTSSVYWVMPYVRTRIMHIPVNSRSGMHIKKDISIAYATKTTDWS